MAPKTTSRNHNYLPTVLTSPAEVGRLIREIEAIDNFLKEHELRHQTKSTLPKTSLLLEETAQLNKLNMLHAEDRQRLQQFLVDIKERSPVIHVSFSADPSPLFAEKLVTWLRREIHPLLLLNIGLQPNIGAGCILRTTNKYFDFSLKQDFANKRNLLRGALALPPTETKA